jgi:hypothetical protein
MTMPELIRLVKDMRRAQRQYFDTRSPIALDQARKLERAVDKMLTEYDGGQTQMFAAPTEGQH